MQCFIIFRAIDQIFMLADQGARLKFIMPEERRACTLIDLASTAEDFSFERNQLRIHSYRGLNPVERLNRSTLSSRSVGYRVILPYSNNSNPEPLVYGFLADSGSFQILKTENGTAHKIVLLGEPYDFIFSADHLYFCHENALYDFDVHNMAVFRTSVQRITGKPLMLAYSFRFSTLQVPAQFVQRVITRNVEQTNNVERYHNLTRKLEGSSAPAAVPYKAEPVLHNDSVSAKQPITPPQSTVHQPHLQPALLPSSQLPRFKKLELYSQLGSGAVRSRYRITFNTLGFIVLSFASLILAKSVRYELLLLSYQ